MALDIPVDTLRKTAAFKVDTLYKMLMPDTPYIVRSKEDNLATINAALYTFVHAYVWCRIHMLL